MIRSEAPYCGPRNRRNRRILGAGLAALALGYAALAAPPADGFLSLTLGPLLLSLGYAVLIPLGLVCRPA